MNLFLDVPSSFEKISRDTRVSDDTNKWPQEILDELLRAASFTGDYSPRVVLSSVEPDKRYGFGHVELLNSLAINPRDDITPKGLKGQMKVLVPVIIKEGRLKPLDTFLSDGSAEPLTEKRLRKAMFRPVLFDSIQKAPGDVSMVEQLYPPHRQYGGSIHPAAVHSGSMGKMSSITLLDLVLPTIKEAHATEVFDMVGKDPSLYAAVVNNPAMFDAVEKLATIDHHSSSSYAEKVASSVKPTVVQVTKAGNVFRVKTASSAALSTPRTMDVPKSEAESLIGPDKVKEVESNGSVTVTTNPVVKETLQDDLVKVIDEFGLYKVRTVGTNKDLVGWVFPSTVDLDGTVLPLSVFSNGSQGSVQEKIAGTPIARSTDVVNSEPKDNGCFYYSTKSGSVALVPVRVIAEVSTPDAPHGYQCETVMGEKCTLVRVPGLKTVSKVGDGRYGVPEDCGFAPLNDLVELTSSPEDVTKLSQALNFEDSVRVSTDGSVYAFHGEPIKKLSSVLETQFLNRPGAMFVGAVLGQDMSKFSSVLDAIHKLPGHEKSFMAGPVQTLSSLYSGAEKRAATYLSTFPSLRVNLWKEAAVLEDPTSVDSVLSVNFINPENVAIFAEYTGQLENTVKKLSELLIAVRMGLSGVSEGAVERSISRLDTVIESLKSMTTQA